MPTENEIAELHRALEPFTAEARKQALDKDQVQNKAGLDLAKGDFSAPTGAAEPSSAGISLYREAAKLGGLREKLLAAGGLDARAAAGVPVEVSRAVGALAAAVTRDEEFIARLECSVVRFVKVLLQAIQTLNERA
jgi:hypothetical protein